VELVASAIKRLAEVFAAERQKLESERDKTDNVWTEDLRIAPPPVPVFLRPALVGLAERPKRKSASSEARTRPVVRRLVWTSALRGRLRTKGEHDMSILAWIVLGLLAGFIGSKLVNIPAKALFSTLSWGS
jgi:hypothetical protein